MSSSQRATDSGANSPMVDIKRSHLDDLPFELRSMLVNFNVLEMRAVLALVPQLRIRRDDISRARKRLCEWAAGEGHLNLLKWAHEREYPLLQVRDGKDVCKAAARGGQLAVLQWLRAQKCRWNEDACLEAAQGGHLEVLQWVSERGCPWGLSTVIGAARGGHLHVLKWLRANGCEWHCSVALAAAEAGHVEVLEWVLANRCPISFNLATTAICCSGDLRLFEWGPENGFGGWCAYVGPAPGLRLEVLSIIKERHPYLIDELSGVATCQLALVGDLEGLQWARENAFFDPMSVSLGAVEGGQLAVFQWALESGVYTEGWDCDLLAYKGHLECLKWAVAHGGSVTAATCACAAAGGHLNVLQWLREEANCEWDGDTLGNALLTHWWEVFEWARQRGCPANASAIKGAIQGGYLEVLQWALNSRSSLSESELNPDWCGHAANTQVLEILRSRGFTWREKTCAVFALRGELELLQWARREGCPWSELTCSVARQNNNLYMLQWASENGCPMDEETLEWWSQYNLEEEFQESGRITSHFDTPMQF